MNSNGVCTADYSPTVQVLTIPTATAGFISGGNVSVCKTSNSTTLSLNNYVGKIQWQKSLSISENYSNILTAPSATYTSTGLTTTTYFRAVLSSGVCAPQITEPVVIQVESSAVSKTISGASTVCFGENKTLTYGTDSVGAIQWQYSTESSSSGFIDINNENVLTYSTSDLQQTTWFRVKNTSICNTVYSPAVQIIVNSPAKSGFILGGNVNVCKTSNSTILSLNNYVGKIQWQKASLLTGIYSNILSATSASYTASGLTTTTYFRAVLSSGVCAPQITEPVVIQVESAAVSKTISGSSAVCSGESKTLTYGTGSIGTIQWQFSTQSSTTGFVNVEGENGLIYNTTNLQQTTWFRVMNTIGSCSIVYSPAIQIIVNPKAVSGFISGGNVNVCKSSNTTVLSLNNSVGNIQWQKASSLTGTYINVSSNTSSYTATGLIAKTYFRAILSSGICTPQITEPIFIDLDELTIAKTIAGASAVCYGDSKALVYETGSVGTIQWEYSNTSSATGFIEINNEKGLTLTTHSLQSNTWFRVKNTNGSCPNVFSTSVQVVVNQKPISGDITGGNITVCKTSNSTVLRLQNYFGTIQWQKASTYSGTYSTISSANSTSYTISGLITSGYFRAVLSNGGCTTQTTEPVYIKIDEPAVVKSITGATPICFGESQTLFYETGSVGAIQWQYSTTSNTSGFADKIGENDLTYFANNLKQTTWFRVKNTSGVCPVNYSTPVQILVNTTPPPLGNKTQYFNFTKPILISNLVVTGTDIKWYSNNTNALAKINSLQSTSIVTLGSTYYATQTLNGCVSISPLAIAVTNSLKPELD